MVKLYVRNNEINSINSISTAPNLTHLYIINNKVQELPVNKLTKLQKLYAGGNCIQVCHYYMYMYDSFNSDSSMTHLDYRRTDEFRRTTRAPRRKSKTRKRRKNAH